VFEPRTVKLKDNKEVLIRAMKREDFEGSFAFFRALPEESRLSLRRDLSIREVVEERIRELEEGAVKRLSRPARAIPVSFLIAAAPGLPKIVTAATSAANHFRRHQRARNSTGR